jgi:hypothetical protein
MGQTTLVERHLEDAKKLLARLGQEHFDVTAAAWIKPDDESKWYLYIVSRAVDAAGASNAAYLALGQVVRSMPDLWIESDDIKLIGASEPMARDLVALKLQPRYTARIPERIPWPRLGGRFIQEVLWYPPPSQADQTEAPASGGS